MTRRSSSLIALLAASSAWFVSANSLGAAPAGDLLFTRGKPGYGASKPSIYLASSATKDSILIRNGEGPAVSHRGRMIAFARQGIWVSDLHGRQARRLTRGTGDYAPAWSVDDKTIFFSRSHRTVNVSAIFSVRIATKAVRKLTHPVDWGHGPCHSNPAPSPDGRLIAYTNTSDCDHGTGSVIAAITPTGKRVPIFTRFRGPGEPSDLTWSPDGQSVAFTVLDLSSGGPDTGLWVAHADGSAPKRIFHGEWPSEPAWSPDGRWIAFVVDVPTPDGNAWKGQIWLVRRDGTRRHVLRDTAASDRSPAWLPSR